MVSRSALFIGLAALIAASAPASALARPAAPTPGITAARSGDTLTLTLTPQVAQAARVRAGTRTEVSCQQVPPSVVAGPLLRDASSDLQQAWASATVAADGTTITYDLAGARSGRVPDGPVGTLDTCTLSTSVGVEGRTREIGSVALTPAGVTAFDEGPRVVALKAVLVAAKNRGGRYVPAAQVRGAVPLASADATPPAGQIGYWTDGSHAAVVTLSAAGHRLFLEDQGDLVLRTNAIGQIPALFYGDLFDSLSESSSSSDSKDPESDGSDSPYGDRPAVAARDGVRVAVHGRRVSFRFTGASVRALRKVAGRKVRITCFTPAPPSLFPPPASRIVSRQATKVVRVAEHGATALAATLPHPVGSVCSVTDEGDEIAFGATSAAGRRTLADAAAILLFMRRTPSFLAAGGQHYATTAQVVARDRRHLVALRTPGAKPPLGRVGVWTDGARRAEMVVASASGARFLFDDQGDGSLRTNYFANAYAVLLGVGT